MPWIEFTDDFDFTVPNRAGRITIVYKRGMVENVTRECADQARAAKKAKDAPAPGGKAKADGEPQE